MGPSDRYLPGDVIASKYRLVRVLGEGGMGVVWVARNLVLEVDVAIKLIGQQGPSRQSTLAQRHRGQQEARTAAKLGHPAICRALDFGESHLGDPFVVSDLMHGEDLADMLDEQGRLPATRAVQILLPLIDGLAVAHAQGIVHRDVKPDNIFLSRDVAGRIQPKLLDFGIARFVETDTNLTVEGTLLGTPDYMSPEQARGEGGADFRTDIWSTCAVLYEAVTGDVPFDGDNYNAVLFKVVHEPVQSIVERRAGDQALWLLLERGLQKDREARWQSMRELGEALALWLYDQGVREDICGMSVRASWLEAGLSEVRLELPDSIPPAAARKDAPEAPSSDDQGSIEPLASDQSPAVADTLAGGEPALSAPKRHGKVALVGISATTLLVGAALAAGVLITDDRSDTSSNATPAAR